MTEQSQMEVKSKKPADTAFRQQRLNAFQPILTPSMVVVLFLVLGIPFMIIGGVLTMQSAAVVEYKKQYDGAGTSSSLEACKYTSGATASCEVVFHIKEKMEAPVYVYYELTNFYQNHRRYVKSTSADQLTGLILKKNDPLLLSCDPLKWTRDEDGNKLILNPCGLIANTLFNDKITMTGSSVSGAHLKTTGIAWESDLESKYNQPDSFRKKADPDGTAADCANMTVCEDSVCINLDVPTGCRGYNCSEPDYYDCDKGLHVFYYAHEDTQQYLYQSFPEVVSPLQGVENEHFIVWMRTAALPEFRKLYGKINTDLPKDSTVTFAIDSNFPVRDFRGTKSLVISTTTAVGGRNPFLGIAFLVVGSISLLVGILLAVKMFVFGKRGFGDESYLE